MAFPFFGKKKSLASPPAPPKAGTHKKANARKANVKAHRPAHSKLAVDAQSVMSYLKHLGHGVSSMQSLMTQSQNKYKNLDKNFQDMAKDFADFKSSAQAEIEGLRSRQGRVAVAAVGKSESHGELTRIKSELATLRNKIAAVRGGETRSQMLKEDVLIASEDIGKVRENISETKKSFETFKVDVKNNLRVLEKHESQLTGVTKNISELRNAGAALRNLKPSINATQNSLNSLQSEQASLREELGKVKEKVSSSTAEASVSNLETEVKKLRSKISAIGNVRETGQMLKEDVLIASEDIGKAHDLIAETRKTLEKFKASANSELASIKKNHDWHGTQIAGIMKLVSPLGTMAADFSNFKQSFAKSQKKNSGELWNIRESVSGVNNEVSNFKSELESNVGKLKASADSQFGKVDKTISELKKTDSSLKGLANILDSDLKNMGGRVKEVISTFKPETLRKLKSSLEAAGNFAQDLSEKEKTVIRDMGKITRGISSLEQHAETIESENVKTKELAEGLEKTSDELGGMLTDAKTEIEDMKNRFNVAINSASDMEQFKSELQQKMSRMEGKMNTLLHLRNELAATRNSLTELAGKVAEIDRTVVRTFVIK